MKKILILLLLVSFVFSFILAGTGCKEEAAPAEEAEETTEELEEVAEEVEEEVEEAVEEETEEFEPVTLEYWTAAAEEHTYVQVAKMAAAIVKEKYNITVNVVPQGVANYRELMTTSGMSQTGPDISQYWLGEGDIVNAGRQQVFLPLNDIVDAELLGKLTAIEGATDPDTGDIYGIPFAVQFACFAYNKNLMEQAGIDYNSFPDKWTYDEFMDVCQTLKDAGITPFCFANKEGYFSHWWHGFMLPTFFDSIEEAKPAYKEKPINKEPFISFCQDWKDFYQAGYYLEGGATTPISELWGQFTNGDGAMGFASPGIIDIYLDGLGNDVVGMIEWAAMGDGELSKGNPVFGDCVGICNWTEHPEEAAKFVEAFVTVEEIVAKLIEGGNINTNPDFNIADFNVPNPVIAEYLAKHTTLPTYFTGQGYMNSEYQTVVQKFCNLMMQGEISIEDYAAEIDAITE